MKRIHMTRRHREWVFGYLFIGIWLIGFALFTVFPIGQSLIYSLKEVRISSGGLEIVAHQGLTNYEQAFTYIYFVEALWNYVLNTMITIPAIVVFSIVIGLLLNQKVRFRGFFRTIYFLPVIISSGPVLSKIQSEGATRIPSLSESAWVELIQSNLPVLLSSTIQDLFSKIVIIMWFTGVPVLIVLAGLQKIDRAIYESAAIDGASAWEAFWKITLPSIRPLINIIIVFSIVSISIFSSNELMSIIDARKYTQYGLANAFSWIHFIVTLVLLSILLGLANIRVGGSEKRVKKRRRAS